MSHTPGPCHIHWPGDDGFPKPSLPYGWEANCCVEFGKAGEDFGGFLVCGFRGSCRERDEQVQTYHLHQWANLIAAAPDLLAACERARKYCEAMEQEGPFPFNRTPLQFILAALAKAKPTEPPTDRVAD